jgi:YHS domain-containing protein
MQRKRRWRAVRSTSVFMRRLLAAIAVAALAACDAAPTSQASTQSKADAASMQTVTTVRAQPAPLDPPAMLQDEAPPPKPKTLPWQTATPIVFSAEDERLRASLPFTPAIAMDPIDGSKISIRANTPTFEYKGKIYYFANDANKHTFTSDPERALKGGYMRL